LRRQDDAGRFGADAGARQPKDGINNALTVSKPRSEQSLEATVELPRDVVLGTVYCGVG
jgi:hypothetical protein